MDSINQTLRKAREIDQRYKQFLQRKVEQDKSIEETYKKIDKAQNTLKETKETLASIDNLYTKLEKVLAQSIDAAVKSVQKNTLLTVAEPGFQPNRVDNIKIAQLLKEKKKVLVLTGAGISAASGIPTFRGDDGFWNKEQVIFDPDNQNAKLQPQIVLTKQFYWKHPAITWKWLKQFYELKIKSKPNKGHLALQQILQELKRKGKEVCLVTQNIDNLHIEAQEISKNKSKKFQDFPIHEIHGNILKIRCNHCSIEKQKLFQFPYQMYMQILEMKSKLFCPSCQGPLRPHIMFFDQFYEEIFNDCDTIRNFSKDVDAVIVIGTALETGLASEIVMKALQHQIQIVEINPSCTIRKSKVWWIEQKAQKVLEEIKINLMKK